MVITSSESRSPTTKVPSGPPPIEVLSVKCESCGFTEECTPAYIHRVKERYQGRWICGLCVEAVKDEVIRSDMLISTEEALNRHISFYKKFRSLRSSSLKQGAEHPISAMGRVLRRSMDSPRHLRSSSSSDLKVVEGVHNSGLVQKHILQFCSGPQRCSINTHCATDNNSTPTISSRTMGSIIKIAAAKGRRNHRRAFAYNASNIEGVCVFSGAASILPTSSTEALLEAMVAAGITARDHGFHHLLFLTNNRNVF